jgi:hypothetical protein
MSMRRPSIQRPRPLLGATILSAAAFALAASTAAANPPGNIDCPPGQTAVNGTCVDAGDPPPPGPTLKVDLAQQNTDRAGTHVRGYATATDTSRAMSVQFKIDGVVKSSATANVSRTDVGKHGFDLTVPSARGASQVCVVATDPENNGRTTACRSIDRIKQFDATSISYDTEHAVIEDSEIVELDTVTNTNATSVTQATTVSGSHRLIDTSSWSDTQNLVVYAGGKLSIPVVGDLGVEVTDTSTFVQNGSTEDSHKWAWEQEVVVPAESKVVASITITRSTLTVPYTLTGSYEYDSGAKAAGTLDGIYHGVNSHGLDVDLRQYGLDGSRAAHPAAQPKPLQLQRIT